jgi:hypothetical protein
MSMRETIRLECLDCEADGRIDIWYAIYLTFYEIPLGDSKMINLIDQRSPTEHSKVGGENISTHHNTNWRNDGRIKHSQFRVLRVDDKILTPIGRLVCSTSSQIFHIETK